MSSYTEENPLVWYIASIRAADLAYTIDVHTEIEASQQITVDQIASAVESAITVEVTDEDGNVENVTLQDYVAQQQIVSDAIRQEVEKATTYYEEGEDGNLVPVKYESLASSFNQFANNMTLNFENLTQSQMVDSMKLALIFALVMVHRATRRFNWAKSHPLTTAKSH